MPFNPSNLREGIAVFQATFGIRNGNEEHSQAVKSRLRCVDLFCGTGGISAGFVNAGIEVQAAYDSWNVAIDTYRRNLTHNASILDLSETDVAIEEIKRFLPEIIAGGPPCQDFSTAGKRIEGDRADLTKAFASIVATCRPTYYLMENVPQVRSSLSYKAAREKLADAEYEICEVVLDASECGVPQRRRRFFSFGSLDQDATEIFLDSLRDRLATKPLTVKNYLGDEIDVEFYYRHPRNYSRRSVFTVHEPSPTIREVNRPVPPGYFGNHLDSAPPSEVRALTSYERSRIQTFPSHWDWASNDRNSNTELLIGNAVPVNLATFVAKGVMDAAGIGSTFKPSSRRKFCPI